MSIFVIRHSHTEWNGPPHRFQGRLPVPLSKKGILAARKLGRKVHLPDKIITSPAVRCSQTINSLFETCCKQITQDERLWEIDNGYFQGKLMEEVAKYYGDELQQWLKTPSKVRPGGGELLEEMYRRVLSCFVEVFENNNNDDLTTLIVTHAGPIRVMLCHSQNLSLDNFHRMKVRNLDIFKLSKVRSQITLEETEDMFKKDL